MDEYFFDRNRPDEIPMAPPEERVGEMPGVHHGAEATVVVDTGVVNTAVNSTVCSTVPKVTWADVVRKPSAAPTRGGVASESRGQDSSKRSKFVLRSLSQNNPVISQGLIGHWCSTLDLSTVACST